MVARERVELSSRGPKPPMFAVTIGAFSAPPGFSGLVENLLEGV